MELFIQLTEKCTLVKVSELCVLLCMFSLSCRVSELMSFLCSLMPNEEMLSLEEILDIPSDLHSATSTSYSCCCRLNEKINSLTDSYFLINIAEMLCYYLSSVALTLKDCTGFQLLLVVIIVASCWSHYTVCLQRHTVDHSFKKNTWVVNLYINILIIIIT